ncbi:hypothetical protein FRB99_002360 [Tulasnella sp. 403]|nr:hypothetical protein FRB99_002360 [Tulasnella sp. 403]
MSYARPFPTGPRRPESSGDDRPGRPTHQRQMTASSGRTPPPPAPLGLPEPTPPPSTRSSRSRARSKSPLRNSFSSNATNSEEDHFTDAASSTPVSVHGHGAPNPAVNRLSAFLRAGSSFIGSSASSVSENRPAPQRASTLPQSPGGSVLSRLTDAELEAQAMREKENSRLEAERILMMEADQRRKDEERVLTILRTDVARANVPPLPGSPRNAASPKLLPLTPAADVSAPTTPRKEDSGNWMSGLVKKLTPTKDLTPAQQIINETKAREKEIEKEKKRAAKGHRGWPSTSDAKLADPAFLSLAQAATPSTPTVSPSSRLTPSNYSPLASGSPRVGGHPMINGFSPSTPTPPQRTHGPPGGSPVLAPASGESTPLYALFNQEGTLDVPATLITIARRFEKLEKWTVSHVRALEERMKDVEKYALVLSCLNALLINPL